MPKYNPYLLERASKAINRPRIAAPEPSAAEQTAMSRVAQRILSERSAKQHGGTGLPRVGSSDQSAKAEAERRLDALGT